MKIVAALCWYDEPDGFLERLLRSLVGHVDEVVALDGAWQGFPNPKRSSGDQRHLLGAVAREIGLLIRIDVPVRVWKSQIEKRQRLFDIAIKEQHADWVLIVDGDFILAECDDLVLRQSLELTSLDVAKVLIRPLNQPWPYSELRTNPTADRMIWRGHPDLTMEHLHYGIRIGNRWLHGDTAYVNVEPALDLSRVVVIDHDNMNRSAPRVAAMKQYRKIRAERKLETWQ